MLPISNAEPIDSITVDGAGALTPNNNPIEDNLYSIPTSAGGAPSSTETDNALTEYTLVKEVQQKADNLHPDLEIYSSASTLSLGETIILSDGWLNRTTPQPQQPQTEASESQDSHFVLTLDVDTSASVI